MKKRNIIVFIAFILLLTLLSESFAQNSNLTYKRLTITENTEITNEITISEIVTIKNNSTLTVKGKLLMKPESKIIIKPGATLILDGGTLTNAYVGMWNGVEVRGDPESSNPEDQGKLIMRNNAVIENAEVAIRNHHDNSGESPSITDQGGIVQVNQGTLRNNKVAANFMDHNLVNQSYFTHSDFVTDDDFIGDEFETFIKLSNIESLAIGWCNFSNLQTQPYNGCGIDATHAGFIINQDNVFTNLEYGIKAKATTSNYLVRIQQVDFINNKRGVYLSGVDNAEVTGNDFQVPFNPAHQDYYGLYLDQCTGYMVEENIFQNALSLKGEIGLYIYKSGDDPNMIYNNTFTDLQWATVALGHNHSTKVRDQGLCYKCNDFADNEMDIVIVESEPPANGDGIKPSQGASSSNPEDMAGNLFDIHGQTPNDDFDDINNEASHITYYYPQNYDQLYEHVKPVDYTENTVTIEAEVILPDDWTFENGCPEEPGGGGHDEEELKGQMAETGFKIDSTENLLLLLVDAGDTESLQTEVDNSIPPETMEVYNELMSKSPWLSDTVVSTAIEKENVLPGAMIRDIMVANPQTAKSDALMNKLDERWDPLPEYMKAQILQGRSIVSIKEETESRLANFKLKRAKAYNALVRYYLGDTINPAASYDSLEVLLENGNSLNAKYSLAFLSGEQGAWSMGTGVLNDIPSQFELTDAEVNAHMQMVAYYNLLSDLAQEGKTFSDADSLQLETLFDIEATTAGIAHVFARNVLLALGEIEYEEPIILPDLFKSSEAVADYEELLSKAAEAPGHIKVQPNPAKDYIIVEYDLESETGAVVEINNISGKLKYTKNVFGKKDQFTVDTRNWKAGIYIAVLKINGKLIESFKFTIID